MSQIGKDMRILINRIMDNSWFLDVALWFDAFTVFLNNLSHLREAKESR